jgi:DNA-binding Lrp family transcriptional regulator
MVQAYVLVQTSVGRSAQAAQEIRGLPGVVTAHDVTGPYDIVVLAEAETMDALGQLVVGALQQVPGITRTTTCPVVKITQAGL